MFINGRKFVNIFKKSSSWWLLNKLQTSSLKRCNQGWRHQILVEANGFTVFARVRRIPLHQTKNTLKLSTRQKIYKRDSQKADKYNKQSDKMFGRKVSQRSGTVLPHKSPLFCFLYNLVTGRLSKNTIILLISHLILTPQFVSTESWKKNETI